jgi:NitT/TauT family transport system permease protein
MTEASYSSPATQTVQSDIAVWIRLNLRLLLFTIVILMAIGVAVTIAGRYQDIPDDAPIYANSTLGPLAIWMTEQSAIESPVSALGRYSRDWALQVGAGADGLAPSVLHEAFRQGLVVFCVLIAFLGGIGLVGLWMHIRGYRLMLAGVLVGLDVLLFIIPPIDSTVHWLMFGITVLGFGLLFLPKTSNRVVGFLVIVSLLLVAWEAIKTLSEQVGYAVTIPVENWDYTTYPTLEDSLQALESGDVNALILDRRDVDDVIPVYPIAADVSVADYDYPALVVLNQLDTNNTLMIFPVNPSLPGRLRVVVRAEDATRWASTQTLVQETIGTTAGEFADERFLALPRSATIVDLKIFNDINLPHLQTIASALLQPARRNGPLLLVRILADAALHTWGEAVIGFTIGATFGFLLGTVLAHSAILQRGLLPYVIASQTIPIIALAPIIVIWLGAGIMSIAVIASYLTFFPVTINTLRGLRSPAPTSLELMHSYGASRWAIMWKLRFPAALPYIFTALKVSATASVVGAIVGELPSGVRDGLGRAILNFSSDYSAISTPKLWGAILMASLIGVIFFLIVSLIEFVVLRGRASR